MSLENHIKFIFRRKFDLVAVGLLFGLLGIVLHFVIPIKYIASGSLYVARKIEISKVQEISQEERTVEEVFTYEGYYARQNALSFSETVIGLVDSDTVLNVLLQKAGKPTNSENLRKVRKNVAVKKLAPQLIEVNVKAASIEEASTTWNQVTNIVVDYSKTLSNSGDPNLVVVKVDKEPLVMETYRNPFLNFVVGVVLGVVFAYLLFSFAEYLVEIDLPKGKRRFFKGI